MNDDELYSNIYPESIILPELIVYGKYPSWISKNITTPILKHILNPVGKFINDEILLNENNIRVNNAKVHPKVMDAIQEGGNIAGAIASAPLAAYTALQALPYAAYALKNASPYFLPSTYIDGWYSLFGSLAPQLLGSLADFGLYTTLALEAAHEVDTEGLNFKNGAGLTLAAVPAIKPVSTPLFTFDKLLKIKEIYLLLKLLNTSIDGTKFNNIPIYHVTDYMKNDLRPFSMTDWGLHVTPNPLTALRIAVQRANDRPHVKEGIFTYTNNVAPVRVSDLGNFLRGLGDFDYSNVYKYDDMVLQDLDNYMHAFGFKNVKPSVFLKRLADYMIAKETSPSYIYKNVFEEGGDSYAILNPKESTVFSKNDLTYDTEPTPIRTTSLITTDNPNDMSLNLLSLFGLDPKDTKNVKIRGTEYTAFKFPDEIYTTLVKPMLAEIENYYNSPEYIARWKARGIEDPSNIIKTMTEKLYNTLLYHYTDISPYPNALTRHNEFEDATIYINNLSKVNPKLSTTIYHEVGGHASEALESVKLNTELIDDWKEHLLKPYEDLTDLEKERVNYLFGKSKKSGHLEIRGQLMPAIMEMHRAKLTPDGLLESDFANTNYNLKHLLEYFEEDYIKKLLDGLLSSTPVILFSKNDND